MGLSHKKGASVAYRSGIRGRAERHSSQQSPYTRSFFMAVIVTVISSVAFLGVLSLALGAG